MFNVEVRPATLQDGVAVMELLESVGYYPDPLSYAKAFRKTIVDPHFLVRVAELDGRIVGLATLSLRYQLGLGGLLAWLDEIAIAPGPHARRAEKLLRRATVGRAPWRSLLRRPEVRGGQSSRRPVGWTSGRQGTPKHDTGPPGALRRQPKAHPSSSLPRETGHLSPAARRRGS
jgi:hypothetical protein